MDLDLFGLLGIPTPVVEEQPKKKQTTKKTASKKPEAKKEEAYSLPLTIVTGWHEPQELGGTGSMTAAKLKEKIHEIFPEYTVNNMCFQLSADKKKVFVGYKQSEVVAKGSVVLPLKFQCLLGGECLIEQFNAEDGEVEISEIAHALEDVSAVFKGCAVVCAEDIVVPVFTQPVLTDRKLPFPINVLFFGRGIMQITKEQYAEVFRGSGSEWDEAEGTISVKALTDLVLKQYPDLDARFVKLLFDKEQQMVLVTPNVPEPATPAAAAAGKKEDTYPTEDVTLSVIFQKLPLDPSLFGGKKKVTKSELQTYVSSIFPEYSGDNVDFIHHKDKKLIVPVLRGSRKGVQ